MKLLHMSMSSLIASMFSLVMVVVAILFVIWYMVSGNREIVREIRELKKMRKVKKDPTSVRKDEDTAAR